MRIKVRYGFENTEKRIGVDIEDNRALGSGVVTGHKQEKPATETK